MIREPSLRYILLALSGMLVWAAHFMFVYVFAALACARGFADASIFGIAIVPATTLAATVAALILLAGLSLWLRRPNSFGMPEGSEHISRFMRGFALLLHALSLVAILWTAASLIAPVCA